MSYVYVHVLVFNIRIEFEPNVKGHARIKTFLKSSAFAKSDSFNKKPIDNG